MDELARAVDEAHRALQAGSPVEAVGRRIPPDVRSEVIELARARIDARQRFPHAGRLFFDATGLRYATPEIVADARATRIARFGASVADVACGVGIQLAYLARRCTHAVGVELDRRRAGYARRNLEALGATARVIDGDALDPLVATRVGSPDVVFCDAARAPGEPERTFGGLSPDPRQVLAKYPGVRAFAFELPPQMPPERIRAEISGEVEYTSLDFALNRAVVYTGPLAEAERTALSLPSGARLLANPDVPPPGTAEKPDAFLYEVDPAVAAAGLVPELSAALGGLRTLPTDVRRALATGPRRLESPFLRVYEVLDVADGPLDGMPDRLRRLRVGHVTLRFNVDPADYWTVRNRIESGLIGPRRVHLFKVGFRWVTAAKV